MGLLVYPFGIGDPELTPPPPHPVDGASSEEDRSDQSPSLEAFLMYYFENSSLRPIVAIVVAHFAVGNAFAMLAAFRDHRASGFLAIVLLLIGSVQILRWERRKRGHLGVISATVAITWVSSLLTAYFGNLYRIL